MISASAVELQKSSISAVPDAETFDLATQPVENSLVDSAVRIRKGTLDDIVPKYSRVAEDECFFRKIAIEYDALAFTSSDETDSFPSKCSLERVAKH